MPPTRPPYVKVQRAKAIIKDGVEVWLKECAECGTEFYGSLKNSNCGKCSKRNKARR